MSDELRNQVVAQCKVVEGLAHSLAVVHSDKAVSFAQGLWPDILEMVGRDTAALMEILGDILNGMDAITEEDSRYDAVFEAAHRRWPTKGCPHCGASPDTEAKGGE